MSEVVRALPRYKQLEKLFGGKWTYNRSGHLWESDDGRMVWGTSSCGCDYDCGSSLQYYCYGGNKKTVQVMFAPQKFTSCTSAPGT